MMILKKILDSDAHGKLFDENLVQESLRRYRKVEFRDAQTVHKNIDKAFADLLGLSLELIEENRKKAMENLEGKFTKTGDSNFGWDDFLVTISLNSWLVNFKTNKLNLNLLMAYLI